MTSLRSPFRGRPLSWTTTLALSVFLAGCGDDDEAAPTPSAFELHFVPTANGEEVGCKDAVADVGQDSDARVGLSDLRFYVSNLQLTDAQGKPVETTLDGNDFQLNSAAGSVALIDATGNTQGTCAGSAIAFAEGTARTNLAISGTTVVEKVSSVSFDIGVPQALMQETVAAHTAEGAPSPLNEMYWTWATGYRHFVFNFTVENATGDIGEGYLHVGSRDCGPEDGLALEDRDACTFVNTPAVSFQNFDLTKNQVAIDIPRLLKGMDLVAPVYDPKTFEVIGEGPGAECHSSPTQPDCEQLFSSLGLELETGAADASKNAVFSAR